MLSCGHSHFTLFLTTGPQQDVSFVPKSKSTRRKRPPVPLVDSTLLRFLSSQKESTKQTETIPQEAVQQQTSSQISWLGQYNRHIVAQKLLSLDGVSEPLALEAGDAVQRHALARTARRRLRLFLRKRDRMWDTTVDTTNALVVMNAQEDDASVAYDLDQVIQLLSERGLTGTDICTILTHTPSVALMRPKADSDASETTLERTVTRAFQGVLSESLQLRKYDARKVSIIDVRCGCHHVRL